MSSLKPGEIAILLINDKIVGEVTLRGSDTSWWFGIFVPNKAFSEFALAFGRWSLLMHADNDVGPVDPETKQELRDAEKALYQFQVELRFEASGEVVKPALVNIDGEMIEWKVY